MTIEEAIELLQERHMTVSMCMSSQDCTKQNAALDMAIAALREKAEREKGCDWCQQKHNRYLFTQIADLNAETPIACPWCGKRLEVEHEN